MSPGVFAAALFAIAQNWGGEMPTDRRKDQYMIIYWHKAVLYNIENKWSVVTDNNVDKS